MEELRKSVISLRCKNSESRYFVPPRGLEAVVTRDAIYRALKDCAVSVAHLDEVATVIARGARRTFSILLLVGGPSEISQFIAKDSFLPFKWDEKLPLHAESLSAVLSDPIMVKEFCEKQWEFLSPTIGQTVLHRELHDDAIFPFLDEVPLGDGSFGTVSEVLVHGDFHQFGQTPGEKESPLRLVKKEFKPLSAARGTHKDELHNLTLLNCLEHPNILKLIGSYTFRKKHNLLFPLAVGGTLAKLLSEERPELFRPDVTFYVALSRLSSGIEALHNYTSSKLNLKQIGCHHDLKPQNILVHHGDFILADFGLSRLRDEEEGSKTPFGVGHGYYLAPECEDLDEDFQKGVIGRASDMWSFGCIIAEVFTYMKRAAQGILEFKVRRKVKFRNFTTYTFHAGRNAHNPGVLSWLEELAEAEDIPSGKRVIQLVKEILVLDPNQRPKAAAVTQILKYVSVEAVFHQLEREYRDIFQRHQSLEAQIEWETFKCWGWALGIPSDNDGNSPSRPEAEALPAHMDYEETVKLLARIQEGLQAARFQLDGSGTQFPLFDELRVFNQDLISLLPAPIRTAANTRRDLAITKTDNLRLLEGMQISLANSPSLKRLGMLATIKRMSILAEERGHEVDLGLYLGGAVHFQEGLGDHAIVRFQPSGEEGSGRPCFAEWIKYAEHWEGDVSQEMIVRVAAVAELLGLRDKPEGFRTLRCIGYYHEASRHSFALVFDFPPESVDRPVPRTLAGIFKFTERRRDRPVLDDRLKLAYDVAVSVLEFHKVNWMHKSISAHNVLCFTAKHTSPAEWLRSPYLVGFNHSRPDEPDAFTEGPARSSEHKEYQHPSYAASPQRHRPYRPEYDYYSLGILLLEIGTWESFADAVSENLRRPPHQKSGRRDLLEKRLAVLAHLMGRRYREVVRVCFDWELSEEQSQQSRCIDFEKLVVSQLAICCL
ncbi:kinase-like domain-containing protein [Lasiosphaeria ovina]|uniref:Kinase-like domain-containing protein n=1 Tax=Lasiosphaeria ovina TaxID=92902 RepID=A0AAE0KLU5_9PEZI|nr:kinase-like domain-containing protein [Lasiosphaeria ovina]